MEKKQRVLVIEDNTVNRKVLVKILEQEYEVLEASNGADGLSLIETLHEGLSAVILDLRMPGMDGLELMDRLREKEIGTNLPIIVATGESDPRLESRCLEAGAWDFVPKPYNASVIKLRVHNVIGRSQAYWLGQIKRMAERDELTGIYNRKHFMQQTRALITSHPEITYALIRMDIDHFRLFNASFGTEAGDRLLITIADSIQRDIGPGTTYGRIESDVFCICTPYNPEALEEHCRRSVENGRSLLSDFFLKFAFGIYIITDPQQDMEKMYFYATEAAHKCKHDLNSVCSYYDERMEEREKYAQKITSEIDLAIREHQFEVYLQPKYSLVTKEAYGAEALIRWNHPQNGLMSPGSFIPVIEKNGMILQVDRYMWESVCILLRRWMDEGKKIQPISVNVSRVSLYHPHLVQHLVELVGKYRIPAKLLNLEITESAYMSDPDLMERTIAQLRRNGFIIFMDDFGSGYSSLNTLKEIEVDVLKVDMKFLPAGKDDVKSEKILASVLRMASWLGLSVIVEGVETEAQKDFLESIGCDYVQGYYFARPMPICQYEKLISHWVCPDEGQTAPKLSQDVDSLWASDSKMGTLLKSVAVPFVIFEVANRQIDILRMNNAFSNTFGPVTQVSRLLAADQLAQLQLALDRVMESGKSGACDCLFIMPNSVGKWYRLRLNYIEASASACLVGATFTDITTERLLEREINRFVAAFKQDTGNKSSLLVVEDSEVSHELIRTMFQDEFEVLSAHDGKEGLEKLEAHADHIALILLDIIMPVMGGMEFLEKKNSMPAASDIPVVVISADHTEGSQLNMLENGISDYVTKPFVPELVKKRVQNVLEYRSRFRNLLQEYHDSSMIDLNRAERSLSNGYSIDDVRTMLALLSEIFDVARIVDPAETAVVSFSPEGALNRVPYVCFKVWGKESRCENCSSMCAQRGACVMTKFELIKNDIFYVISRPIQVILNDGSRQSFVLEVVSHLTGEAALTETDKKSIHALLEKTHHQIYSDPLTGVYNRRYLDEFLFLHQGQNSLTKRVGLIVSDLFEFKHINDTYGHLFGDQIITTVADTLKRQIRSTDSVIRMGGDEFIVTLLNCDQAAVKDTVRRLDAAVRQISYGEEEKHFLQADFGFAYTQKFEASASALTDLMDRADHMMYENKEQHRNQKNQ